MSEGGNFSPWIDVKDLPYAADIIREFHTNLSEDEFDERQKVCRKLWEDHMTPDGFHQDFVRKMKILIKND